MCHFELVYKSFQVTISSFPTGADFKQSQQNSACNRLFCQNTARVRGWIWREHTLRHKMARPPWDAGQPGSQQTITESKLPMLCCILCPTCAAAAVFTTSRRASPSTGGQIYPCESAQCSQGQGQLK